jgi:[pyruvate, water dikinase]-phosphate phosphotransferase / [pyruvate, water dikinase] kinase
MDKILKRGKNATPDREIQAKPAKPSPGPAAPPPAPGKAGVRYNIHLVSDATGETLTSLAKAALAQFEHAEECQEHLWALVRSPAHMERVIEGIKIHPGIVFFTLVDHALRVQLQENCRKLGASYVSVLDPVIVALGSYFGEKAAAEPGRQHQLDAEYFSRIEAMDYTLAHDDGQQLADLDDADIILVGVSRTSKTPTSIYLANRGLKTANVALVPSLALPPELVAATRPLIVGLVAAPERLMQVRRNRLLSLKEHGETGYVELGAIKQELVNARKLFESRRWPVIDVTRRSIEETAAAVLNLYRQRLEGPT